jgi:pyridinium-3,5-biscarboxylic acid mononucleotide sulfurtransferase
MTSVEQAYQTLLDRIAAAPGAQLGPKSKIENRNSKIHAVAFSGGVDSSVVAQAVRTVFPDSAVAMLGVSASLSEEQRQLAVGIARHIGIELRTIETKESAIPAYVENRGMSCYHCKASLYDAMAGVLESLRADGAPFVLYNGNNAEDVADPTRVGLKAAEEHRVHAPLISFDKQTIRAIARHMGLPHWNIAAAPCLRSRLQLGVPATDDNLARVAEAERRIIHELSLPPTVNFRVRHLIDGTAMLEADEDALAMMDLDRCRVLLLPLGFATVAKRPFHSGSVSGRVPES